MTRFDLEYVRSRRVERGLTLQEVAQHLGMCDKSAYSKYEAGTYQFRASMLPELARVLGCSIESFFTS